MEKCLRKSLTTSTSLLDFPEVLPIVLFILQLSVPWRQGYLHRLDDRVDSMDEAGTKKVWTLKTEKESYDVGKFHLTNAVLEE